MPAKGSEDATGLGNGWPSSAAAVIGPVPWRGRAAQAGWSVRVHRSGQPRRVVGGRPECWRPTQAKAGPARSDCCSWVLESLRLWQQGGFTDRPYPAQVITARGSPLAVAGRPLRRRRPAARVADWLSAQGHPVIWESAVRECGNRCWRKGIRHGFRAPHRARGGQSAPLLDGLSAACRRARRQLGTGPVADLNAVASRRGS